ncbi:MAG: hypothetical protein ACRD20_02280 [Terriglobales bacterium]
MSFTKRQVERGKLHTSPGLLKKIAGQLKAARQESAKAKQKARAVERETERYYQGLRKSARAAIPKATEGRVGGKAKLNELFHELYGRNPVAKKRKRKKAMPAGLKRYWAEKRRAKNGKRKKKQRKGFTAADRKRALNLLRRAVKRNRVRNYRKRPRKAKRRNAARRVNLQRVKRLTVPFPMTPDQTRKFASAIARASGRRVRVVRK